MSQGWLTYEILSQRQPGAGHLYTPAQKYYDDDNDNSPMDHRRHWESSTSSSTSNRTPNFSAAFTRSNHCTLYCAKRIYSTPIYTTSLGSILILASQICIVLRSVYFFRFPVKTNTSQNLSCEFWMSCLSHCSVSPACLIVLYVQLVSWFCMSCLSHCSVCSACLIVLSVPLVSLFCLFCLSHCSIFPACLIVLDFIFPTE